MVKPGTELRSNFQPTTSANGLGCTWHPVTKVISQHLVCAEKQGSMGTCFSQEILPENNCRESKAKVITWFGLRSTERSRAEVRIWEALPVLAWSRGAQWDLRSPRETPRVLLQTTNEGFWDTSKGTWRDLCSMRWFTDELREKKKGHGAEEHRRLCRGSWGPLKGSWRTLGWPSAGSFPCRSILVRVISGVPKGAVFSLLL